MTSETRRQEILNRDNNRCRACGFSDTLTIEVDHIVPRTLNGSDDSDNLQALCHFCNNVKGNVLIDSLPIQDAIAGFGSCGQQTSAANRRSDQSSPRLEICWNTWIDNQEATGQTDNFRYFSRNHGINQIVVLTLASFGR